MSLDTDITPTTTTANARVITAIRAHHAQLADELWAGTEAVLSAVAPHDVLRYRDALHDWYRTELLPHAVAEEQALYRPGEQLESTRLLVRGMIEEHRCLESLIADLGEATGPTAAVAAAVATRALFTVHLSKENDLLLPALDEAGLDLGALLDGMHEILGHGSSDAAADEAGGGCGCGGCGCGQDEAAASIQSVGAPGTTDDELDVRTLPHAQRHEIIFARLDQLAPGEELVILNDHDPKPLRYQTSALWPDRFEWTYRESGPQDWRVAITRVD